MADTILQCDIPVGAYTLELYTPSTDTLVNTSGGDALTHRANNKGRATCVITEAVTGYNEARVRDAANNTIALYVTGKMADDTGTYRCFESINDAIIAESVLDEAMSSHTAAGSLGLFLNDQYDLAITGITTGVETRAGKHSVAGTVMMSTNAALSGGTLTAKKPSDDSTFSTYSVTTDAAADNITGMS